jgi:hypothetical protein
MARFPGATWRPINPAFLPATNGQQRRKARHPHTGTNGKPDGICGAKSWAQLLGL